MTQVGKLILLLGVILVVAGVLLWGLGRLGFRGLPGDLHYDSDRVHIYFPLVTCLALSAILTFGFWIWRWLSQK